MIKRRTLVSAIAVLPIAPAWATPDTLRAAIAEVTGGKPLREGKVKIDLPSLVENGNTVPLGVVADLPTAGAGRVVAIHVLNEKNPQPHVYSAALGPGIAEANVSTRIKLADSQKIVAIAETANGEFWTASADVIVTLAACIEDLT